MRVVDVISLARTAAKQIIDAQNVFLALQKEIDSNGGGVWLDEGISFHPDITSLQAASAIYDTANAIQSLLEANGNAHNGNLYRIF